MFNIRLKIRKEEVFMPYHFINTKGYSDAADAVLDAFLYRSGHQNSDKKPEIRYVNIPMTGMTSSIYVVRVDSYNNRVVKVTFNDGSFTKSVCSKNDTFDLDVGITICILKRIIGKNSEVANSTYAKLFRDIHKLMANAEKEKANEAKRKAEVREKQHRAEMKNKAKKMKEKEEAIDIAKQGYIRAMQELDMEDDLK